MNIGNLKKDVMSVINNSALTHEQAMMSLSSIPMNYVEFFETTPLKSAKESLFLSLYYAIK